LVNLLRRLGSGCTISWMLHPTRGEQQSPPHSQTSRLGMVVIAEVIYSYRCCVSFIVVGVLLPTDMSPIPVTRTRDACHFTATVATRTDGPCGHRLSDKCGSFLAPQPLSQILFPQCNMRHKLSEVSLSLVPELRPITGRPSASIIVPPLTSDSAPLAGGPDSPPRLPRRPTVVTSSGRQRPLQVTPAPFPTYPNSPTYHPLCQGLGGGLRRRLSIAC
jgi:hypothetical protein